MVLSILEFKATRANGKNISDILKSVSRPTSIKAGCISTRMWRNSGKPAMLMLLEEWATLEDFRNHVISPVFRKVLLAMELSNEKPVMRVVDCDRVLGLEWIEKQIYGETWEISLKQKTEMLI